MMGKDDGTNVFRESKAGSLLTSTPDRSRLGRTRLRLSCDEYHKQCCGSLMGPVGKANCECSPAVGSLEE